MFRFKLIIIIIIWFPTQLESQENSKHDISISTGLAIALGSFADDQAENDGFADSGLLLDLDFKMSLNESLGINFLYGQAEIKTSFEDYRDKFLQFPDNVNEGGSSVGLSWHLSRIFIGPTYNFNLSEITFQARILGGLVLQDAFLLSTDRGEVGYIIDDDFTYYEESIIYGKPSSSFGMQAGINAALPIGERFGINVGFDYFSTSTETDKETTVNDNNQNFQNLSEKIDYNISTLQFALGLIYKMN